MDGPSIGIDVVPDQSQELGCFRLTLGHVSAPRFTRLLSTIFVAHTVSDFMQVAYRAAEDGR